ncbi:unnamed protein product, partial [Polarella glacialis]
EVMPPKKSMDKPALALELEVESSTPGDSSSSAPHASSAVGQDFMTVIVTPKLSFQLSKRPEWRTVDDISQDDLRRGFLSRFPPALWMSSEKFSFRPALPPTSQLTE